MSNSTKDQALLRLRVAQHTAAEDFVSDAITELRKGEKTARIPVGLLLETFKSGFDAGVKASTDAVLDASRRAGK